MPEQIQLRNMTKRMLICQGVRLLPGNNAVSSVQFDALKANETFVNWQSLGMIKQTGRVFANESKPAPAPEPTVEVETDNDFDPADVKGLAGVDVIKGKAMIAACEDPEKLLEWYEADQRLTIKDACEKRIAKLEALAQAAAEAEQEA